jgi:hypothetical protein
MHIPRSLLFLAVLACVPALASAQQRPLTTEDPETVGAGRVLIEGGFDYSHDIEYPASGLQGNLLRLPLLGVSLGISSIAEIQIDGGFYNRLTIDSRNPAAPLAGMVDAPGRTTSDVEDIVIGTKVRLMPESVTAPSIGVRFATRLPNAGNESGLGLDTTDFFASLLVAKTVQSVRVVGNVGLGILGDPARGDRQNDVLTYGVSFARALTQSGEVVGEINGRADTRKGDPPAGTGSRSVARFGGRYTIGSWRADAAVFFGITSAEPVIGVSTGFTYVFNGFRVP